MFTQNRVEFDKFLCTSLEAQKKATVTQAKSMNWNKTCAYILQIVICYGTDIILGNSKKRYNQISAVFNEFKS